MACNFAMADFISLSLWRLSQLTKSSTAVNGNTDPDRLSTAGSHTAACPYRTIGCNVPDRLVEYRQQLWEEREWRISSGRRIWHGGYWEFVWW